MQNLNLKEFDMRKISFLKEENKGPVIIMLGRRDTGKSFLIRDLLYHHTSIPIGTVMSATEVVNKFYGNIMPKICIHDEYKKSIIQKVLSRQKKVMDIVNKQLEINGKMNIDPRTYVILDDCLYDNSWSKDVLMRMLFMNGRHWKIMLIITMQYPLGIPPVLRTNIDYVFILREPVASNRRRIYDNYAGMFPTFEAFCQIMDQCTENYECLVVDNNSKSNKLSEQIFWYKAKKRPDFKMCSKNVWEQSKKLERDNYNNDEDEYDPSSFKKKNSTQINVRKNKW